MAETAIRFICCVLFLAAGIFDERERKIPRYISYMECICACICWGIRFYVNRQLVIGNLVVSIGLFGVLFFFFLRGQIGRADLYLVFAMFVLLSQGQSTRELIWEENMLLFVAFISAALRLLLRRLVKREKSQPGCSFAIHLLLGYLVAMLV